jgi:carboxypeptidase family protein
MQSAKQKLVCILIPALAMLVTFTGSASAQAQADENQTDSSRTGVIIGRVINENGQPLPNAAVYVHAFNSLGSGRSTTTDGEGNFQVSGLDPVAYVVSASLPAYAPPPRDPEAVQPTYYRVGDSVRLELIKGGVITGNVTTSTGEPVVVLRVRAYMIRDGNDQTPRYGRPSTERFTDDRGVYRIYGLAPGTYVVSAGGGGNFQAYNQNAYDTDTPTYAPSSTSDTATEISVHAGEETANVDIRYRGEPGHVVSGIASGQGTVASSGFTIVLSSIANGSSQWSNTSYQRPGTPGFSFYGVADGDYDVTAESFFPGGEWAVSEHRRIKVRGTDITGIELTTSPLGSIIGRVVLEESKALECKGKRRPSIFETLITPWHNEKTAPKDRPQFLWALGGPATPDKQGDFVLRNLAPGQYRFNARFFAKYWYLQSISLQSSGTTGARAALARSVDAARNWTALKPGERISGLTITLAPGAASFHGRIRVRESQKQPSRVFIYLVPAEHEKAADVLRFFASQVAVDGTFALNNLPPGRYLAIAKAARENESNVLSKLRLPDEAEARVRLRREAVASTEIELKPCQNVMEYQLPLSSAP